METTILKDNSLAAGRTRRLLPVLLSFCMFSTGASGLVNEYVLATMTTYILGNSIEQFSIVIAAMMLMMGVSGLVQQRLTDSNLIGKFMGIEVTMAVVGSIAPLAIYAAFGYFTDHFHFVHYAFVLSVGFLIGFEIPIVMRIIEQQNIGLKTNLALVYGLDYIGAFVGAIIWVKVLLVNFPLAQISFIVAGTNFCIAAITVIYFMAIGEIRSRTLPLAVLAITSAFLVIGYNVSSQVSDELEQRFYDDPIVHKQTSRYQHLVLTYARANNDLRLYINGNTQFSSLDEARYHDLIVHPAMAVAPHARNVLILGGGDGLALREVLKYPRVESVSLIDLDPAMVQMAASHPAMRDLNRDAFADARVTVDTPDGIDVVNVRDVYLPETDTFSKEAKTQRVASVSVFNLDADQFLNERHGQRWDVVIIDFPDPGSVELAKLYSRQFYSKLRAHLAPGAMVAIQSTSPFHARDVFVGIGSTLRASGYRALPYQHNIASFAQWGFHLAWISGATEDEMKERIRNVTSFEVETEYMTPEVMSASLAFGKNELNAEHECVNSIMNPCLAIAYTNYSWITE